MPTAHLDAVLGNFGIDIAVHLMPEAFRTTASVQSLAHSRAQSDVKVLATSAGSDASGALKLEL